MTGAWYTYILENQGVDFGGQGNRRYYVGRTKNPERRMKEHQKDQRKNYKLIWLTVGNYESKIKKFGATNFVECIQAGNFKDI